MVVAAHRVPQHPFKNGVTITGVVHHGRLSVISFLLAKQLSQAGLIWSKVTTTEKRLAGCQFQLDFEVT
jgi:hypothetical protein